MGDGLKRAKLATLETREWSIIGPNGARRNLSGQAVRALYEAIPDETAMLAAVGAERRSDRAFDRAVQVLKTAGLIEYRGKHWQRTGEERKP